MDDVDLLDLIARLLSEHGGIGTSDIIVTNTDNAIQVRAGEQDFIVSVVAL